MYQITFLLLAKLHKKNREICEQHDLFLPGSIQQSAVVSLPLVLNCWRTAPTGYYRILVFPHKGGICTPIGRIIPFIIIRMKNLPPSPSFPGLIALCALLGLGGLALAAAAIWSFFHSQVTPGLLALSIGLLMGGAGLGLFRMKRWGVVLFGLLVLLGSINHMVIVFRRLEGLSASDPAGMLGAVISLAAAILIPLGLAYVAIQLWRQMI
jgi:hypothetical protein